MAFERVWHKSYAPGVPPEIEIQKVTVGEALIRTAKRFPDRTGFIFMGRRITYRELDTLVNRFANALTGLGLKAGDKVGMLLPNLPQLIIANHAVHRLGAVTAMNNPLYTEQELEHQLNDCDARFLITLDLLLPRALALKSQTSVEAIITCHINDYLPFPKKQLYPFVKKTMYRKVTPQLGVHPFTDLIRKAPATPVPDRSRWDDLGALIYTGGTTGVSKGTMLTNANLSSVVQIFRAWFPDLKDGAVHIVGTYPIFHSAGYVVSQEFIIWSGWTSTIIPRPEPGILMETLKKYKPDFLPGVASIFVGLLANPEFRKMDLSFIKGFFTGAAPIAADTVQDLKKLTGKDVYDNYGMTENIAFATGMPWGGKKKIGTVGVPFPNTDVKIVDLDLGETEFKPGEAGEICIKGPQVMTGYYKRPDETVLALRDGWLYTGDIGVMDEEGHFRIVDRKKDLIVAGGYNIYPKDIDELLFEHERILEACAVGVPDTYRGETVKVFVVLKEGERMTEDEVIAYCREHLAAYKVPKRVEFVTELPKSTVGKILRRELRDREIAKQGKT
ncbi:MAG TPA: long-chain fatty acid--CoA ligase [Syntrophales bacterium]|nr:long-chain fatty acid--CoA ligase [Syntrophales bacterium]HOS76999.1 long-chain fatty acid--CoA ligase [Syntrophales bacterium]